MQIAPFAVEQWMNAHETRCELNLAETCVESLTVAQLLDIAGATDTFLAEVRPLKLTYGAIEGSARLRTAIARLYASRAPGEVLLTHGAAGANALVYAALIEPGDRVITIVPTYQQHVSIPESLGADVVCLPLRAEAGYRLDLDELRRLLTPSTKAIALTNPNNPTGAVLDGESLEGLIGLAEMADAWLVADEVYRGASQEGDVLPPSIADLYAKGIAVGSMSKAFSLAGLRLGWICASTDLLRAVEVHRDYTTISMGMIDDLLAALALEHSDAILARSRAIVRTNLEILDRWVASEPAITYVKPAAGTTALLRYAPDLPSKEFCLRLLETTGVLFTPGSAFEVEGTVRIGYANNEAVLVEGLRRTSAFLRQLESAG